MASKEAIARRSADARQKVQAAVESIATSLGIESKTLPRTGGKAPEYAAMTWQEEVANFLEAVSEKLGSQPASAATEVVEPEYVESGPGETSAPKTTKHTSKKK